MVSECTQLVLKAPVVRVEVRCEPEVGQFDPWVLLVKRINVLHQNVGRFEVSVHYVMRVHILDCLAELKDDVLGRIKGFFSVLLLQINLKRVCHELHRTVNVLSVLKQLEHVHYVWVICLLEHIYL